MEKPQTDSPAIESSDEPRVDPTLSPLLTRTMTAEMLSGHMARMRQAWETDPEKNLLPAFLDISHPDGPPPAGPGGFLMPSGYVTVAHYFRPAADPVSGKPSQFLCSGNFRTRIHTRPDEAALRRRVLQASMFNIVRVAALNLIDEMVQAETDERTIAPLFPHFEQFGKTIVEAVQEVMHRAMDWAATVHAVEKKAAPESESNEELPL